MQYALTKGMALVITGPQGCGKTRLAQEIAGNHGTFEVVDAHELDSDFDIGDVLAKQPDTVIVEGAPSSRGVQKLKAMIASTDVICNRKAKEPVRVNTPNFILCTGSPDSLPETAQSRRFRVVRLGEHDDRRQ